MSALGIILIVLLVLVLFSRVPPTGRRGWVAAGPVGLFVLLLLVLVVLFLTGHI